MQEDCNLNKNSFKINNQDLKFQINLANTIRYCKRYLIQA